MRPAASSTLATATSHPRADQDLPFSASRTTARTLCPCARRLRATAPPTLPVTPVIANMMELLSGILSTWISDVAFDCGDLRMNGILEMRKCMNQNFDDRILNGINVLAAIVQCGSFAGAGKALNMSQSGVSRSIARLEARLGIRLFERTTRSVSMTDEGRRLYEQVMPLIAALQEATADAQGGAAAIRGRLRVNVDPFFSRLIL